MSNIQLINLADNINAAILKINDNFQLVDSSSIDVNELTTIVNGILDSDYFLSVINQEYLDQFDLSVDVSYLDSDIAANASGLLQLTSRVDVNSDGITSLSQAITETNASIENLVLDGVDSDLLADAIANATNTLISRVNANSDEIHILAGAIDSVESSLLLANSDLGDLIQLNTSGISQLTTRTDVNSDGIVTTISRLDSIGLTLDQFIAGGIEFTPEQIEAALAAGLEDLYARLDADSDKLVVEAGKVVELQTDLIILDSDLGARIDAETDARELLATSVSYNGGQVTSLSAKTLQLDNAVFIRDLQGNITTTAVAQATSDLVTQIETVDDRVTSVRSELITDLNAAIDSDIAAVRQEFSAFVDSAGTTNALWTLDLLAGTEANPRVAGIKFGNDGATADFTLTADTFRFVNANNNEVQPFTIDGNEVLLSNAKVTGSLDIGTSQTGERMELTNNVISIYDGNNTRRVIMGFLG